MDTKHPLTMLQESAEREIEKARSALRGVLILNTHPNTTIREAMQIGNRAVFALQVLNDETAFD